MRYVKETFEDTSVVNVIVIILIEKTKKNKKWVVITPLTACACAVWQYKLYPIRCLTKYNKMKKYFKKLGCCRNFFGTVLEKKSF